MATAKLCWCASLLVALLSVSACSNIKDTAEPPAELTAIESSVRIDGLWRKNIGAGSDLATLQLSADADNVYSVDYAGLLQSWQLQTGKRNWRHKLKQNISASFGSDAEHLYLCTVAGKVLALAKQDGKIIWEQQLGSQVLAEPAIDDKRLIMQAGDGSIYALDKHTGKLLWQNKRANPVLSLRGNSSPVIDADKVLVGMDNGRLLLLALDTGRVLLELPIGIAHGKTELDRLSDIDAPLLVDGNSVFVSAYNGGSYNIDLSSGRQQWAREQLFGTAASLRNHSIYLLDNHSQLWRLDASTGKTIWLQNKLRARSLNFPTAVADKYIVAGDYAGYIHVIDAASGELLARKQFDDVGYDSRLLVAGDLLLALDKNGILRAMRLGKI